MSDEPTAGEVSRALDQLRVQIRDDWQNLRDDLATFRTDTNSRLDRTLAVDVYSANQRADRLRADQLRDDVQELKQARGQDIEAMKNAGANRAANRKWIIASLIIPLGIGLLDLYFAIKGVK